LAYPHHKKVADVYALASWYCEAENYDQPIVIIIDDLEQCSGDVLGELVMMLRYYAP
jgi:origin recognition complex subunit 3